MTNYPLGHDDAELRRLDKQAVLLHDPYLDVLAEKADSCLEIGCGNGSNYPLLNKANPNIRYTGIDISASAIAAAKARYSHAEFYNMNAGDIQLDRRFDLIFSKLVLWSAGSMLTQILAEARRLLAPNGIFYALEPCNQFIHLYPPKPYASAWMKAWDDAAERRGLNSRIGPSLTDKLVHAGFKQVTGRFVPTIALGASGQRYLDVIENMRGFFWGPAADQFELEKIHHLSRDKALSELADVKPDSLVMDALFVVCGLA